MRLKFLPVSIQSRIILGFSGLILIFICSFILIQIFGLPWLIDNGTFDRHRSEVLSDMEIVSGILGKHISSWFTERRANVNTLSISSIIRLNTQNSASDIKKNITSEFNQFLKANTEFDNIVLIDSNDSSIIAADDNYSSQHTNLNISSTVFKNANIYGYPEIFNIYSSSQNEDKIQFIRQVLSVETPNKIIAILIAEIDMHKVLHPIMESVGNIYSPHWKWMLVSNVNGKLSSLAGENSDASLQKNTANLDLFQPVKFAISGIDGPYDGPNYDGRPILAFHRHIRIGRGLAFALVLTIDKTIAYQPAWSELILQAILWGILFIIGITLCIFLARQISKPISELTNIAHKIQAGNLTIKASEDKRSEIGQLSIVFNGMIDRLRMWRQNLEQQVNERTRELRESEESLAITLQSIGDAVIATDINGNITRMNSTAEKLTDWNFEDAKNKPLAQILKLINAETRREIINPVNIVLEKGKIVGIANHTILISRTAKEYQISDSAAPIRDTSGNIRGVILVFSDITDKYRAAEELRKGKILLDETSKIAHVGGWELQVETMSINWTEELYRIHEVDFSFYPTLESAINFYTPESKKIIAPAIQRAIEFGEPFNYELQIITAKANIRWVHIIGKINHTLNKITSISGVFQDITQRKTAEEKIRAEEWRFSKLFAGMPSGVAIYQICSDGEDFIFKNINPAGERISKVKRDEIVGKSLFSLFPGVKKMGLFSMMQKVWRTGETQHLPVTRYEDNRISQTVENRIFKFGDNEIVTVYDDVTEYKQLQEQLIHSEKLSAVGQLAAGIAHEFNNILAINQTNAQLLKLLCSEIEILKKNELMECVNIIIDSDNRGSDIVQNMIMFAKPQKPSMSLIFISDIIDEVIKLQKKQLEIDNITIIKNYNSKKKYFCDVGQMQQVFLNLIINARHAIKPAGYGKIIISIYEKITMVLYALKAKKR